MSSNPNIPPLNPVPPVVVALALAIFAIEAAQYVWGLGLMGGTTGLDHHPEMIRDYGISGYLVSRMIELGRYPPEYLMRFVTYAFVHASFTHMLFACVLLLAFGKFVGEVMRPWAVLVVFFAASIIGALVYGLIIDSRMPLIGAYPGVYGLIGAFTFLLWVSLVSHGENGLAAFSMIGFLLLIQLVFGLFFGAGPDWIADVAGFVTGFVLSIFICTGGWARVLQKLRRN